LSTNDIEAFRSRLNAEPSLGQPFLAALQKGPDAVVAMAQGLGYEFSLQEWFDALPAMAEDPRSPLEEEAKRVLLQGQDELADYELDLVSAGGNSACAGGGDRSDTGAGS
jgi:predicted ribosomally synthesized peptide with nif11-like leader